MAKTFEGMNDAEIIEGIGGMYPIGSYWYIRTGTFHWLGRIQAIKICGPIVKLVLQDCWHVNESGPLTFLFGKSKEKDIERAPDGSMVALAWITDSMPAKPPKV